MLHATKQKKILFLVLVFCAVSALVFQLTGAPANSGTPASGQPTGTVLSNAPAQGQAAAGQATGKKDIGTVASMPVLMQKLLASTGAYNMTAGQLAMIGVGLLLLFLAISKGFEPLLLIPIGFGAVLSNIPLAGIAGPHGLIGMVYTIGVESGVVPSLSSWAWGR